jgi:hypothetical protein
MLMTKIKIANQNYTQMFQCMFLKNNYLLFVSFLHFCFFFKTHMIFILHIFKKYLIDNVRILFFCYIVLIFVYIFVFILLVGYLM